ncbi:hypothetical protein WISP_52655 [Willisornis vidua]|uniref:Uncharacterized protein n=1 Tax=Willisornis vidua TaxID=1566151 RepID=A0ABQ9DJ04_9PASS|nr:hypothetical protein WISP_52655 [Willisornis vidua]
MHENDASFDLSKPKSLELMEVVYSTFQDHLDFCRCSKDSQETILKVHPNLASSNEVIMTRAAEIHAKDQISTQEMRIK